MKYNVRLQEKKELIPVIFDGFGVMEYLFIEQATALTGLTDHEVYNQALENARRRKNDTT